MLESPHSPEIKEQALCIIGNIAAGAGITDYVMENERILKKLFDFIVSSFSLNVFEKLLHLLLNTNEFHLCIIESQGCETSGRCNVCNKKSH